MNDETDPEGAPREHQAAHSAPAGEEASALNDEIAPARIDDALANTPSPVVGRSRALNDVEASTIAAANRTTVVVLAGEVGSGKTTLLAALYERFGRGTVAGRKFAGSTTLPGFEARCWGLRQGSGREVPAMPHTQRNALPWLHLRVATERGRAHDLLLGDFDGELFQDVVDGKNPATAVPALRRADHLAIVLDGDSLADSVKRHACLQRAIDLVVVLGQERDAIADPKAISLVLTKQDVVLRAAEKDRIAVQAALEKVRDAITESFAGYVPAVISTAAISRIRDLPLGHGTDELLDLWCRHPFVVIGPQDSAPYVPPPADWLARFTA